MRRLLAGEIADYVLEKRYLRKDGSSVWSLTSVTLRRDSAGKPQQFIGVIEDITPRKQVEKELLESEERFRTLADNISQFAWMADAKGWIFWYNRRWYDYTGTTFEEMQGWGWRKVHHPDHVERVVARIQHSWDTGQVWEDLFPLRGKDGEYRWFLSRALPIHDDEGNVVQWFGTNTDVTEQRAAEEALKEADRRKDEFLATLAHELRNPLAPIRNALQILKVEQQDRQVVEDLRKMMERQIDQMVRLVDDLLDVSRITRNRLELRKERVALSSVIESAIETSRPLIEAGGHELEVDVSAEPIPLNADLTRLAQVFSNLLNNAAKYTDPGGRIGVSAVRQGLRVVVTVRDSGVGIPTDMLPKVFEMFTQVDPNRDRSHGGLGIGLTLVKRLVEMHGGSIEAKSAGLGSGSEFVVRLPVIEESVMKGDNAMPDTANNSATARRILVVDDNIDAAKTLALLLKLMGHQTHTAHDGEEAVAAAERIRPELMLLDIGLPKMNGYEVCRAIRQQPWGQGIRMFAVTGWGQDEDRQKSTEAGFDGHLVKPVAPDALRSLMADLAPHSV